MRMKKQIKALLDCKIKGICDRDALTTVYIANRVEFKDDLARSRNELYRKSNDLPECPPQCDEPAHGVTDV